MEGAESRVLGRALEGGALEGAARLRRAESRVLGRALESAARLLQRNFPVFPAVGSCLSR